MSEVEITWTTSITEHHRATIDLDDTSELTVAIKAYLNAGGVDIGVVDAIGNDIFVESFLADLEGSESNINTEVTDRVLADIAPLDA